MLWIIVNVVFSFFAVFGGYALLKMLFLRTLPRPDLLFRVREREEFKWILYAASGYRRVYGCGEIYLLLDRTFCEDPEMLSAAVSAGVILLRREE